jgi:hypothetical protein
VRSDGSILLAESRSRFDEGQVTTQNRRSRTPRERPLWRGQQTAVSVRLPLRAKGKTRPRFHRVCRCIVEIVARARDFARRQGKDAEIAGGDAAVTCVVVLDEEGSWRETRRRRDDVR